MVPETAAQIVAYWQICSPANQLNPPVPQIPDLMPQNIEPQPFDPSTDDLGDEFTTNTVIQRSPAPSRNAAPPAKKEKEKDKERCRQQ